MFPRQCYKHRLCFPKLLQQLKIYSPFPKDKGLKRTSWFIMLTPQLLRTTLLYDLHIFSQLHFKTSSFISPSPHHSYELDTDSSIPAKMYPWAACAKVFFCQSKQFLSLPKSYPLKYMLQSYIPSAFNFQDKNLFWKCSCYRLQRGVCTPQGNF